MELRGTRATDGDRELTITRLHDAYVDGQLDSETRDGRVDRALKATTLAELRRITADLQGPPPAPTTPARERWPAALLALAVLVVVGTAIAWLRPDAATWEPVVEPAPVTPTALSVPELEPEPEPVTNLLTPSELRRFAKAYEKQFATTETYSVVFREDRHALDVPSRGSRPRVEGWSYTSEGLAQHSEASAVSAHDVLVDIGDIDLKRMLANIETAKARLNVEDAELSHVVFRDWNGGPQVIIYVDNSYEEAGRLHTHPDGSIISRFPYPL